MIWIISGTQDGREIGAELADREMAKPEESRREILMTVVSQYGKVLAAHKALTSKWAVSKRRHGAGY